jgi:membrane protease YdiL (CAAX protease family)
VERRLPLLLAASSVVLGAFAAQLAGAYATLELQAFLKARGVALEALTNSAVVIVPSIVVSAACLVTVALVVPAAYGVAPAQALGLRRAPLACYGAAAVGTVMLGPTADYLMRAMQSLLPELSLGVVPMLHEVVRGLPLIVAFPVFALLPGVSEELMFRGLLQNAAGRGWFAIALSALGFSLFHLDPHHVAGVLPLGVFLAWCASRCGTLVTIFAHVVNNAAAIAAVHSSTFDVGYGTDQPMPWQWLPVSWAFVVAAVAVIVRATAAHRVHAHGEPAPGPGSAE